MTSRTRSGLAGILLFGLALRLIALQSRSIAYDDAFSILLSQTSLASIISGTAADTMPPLYYFLLHFWMLIGGNALWWLRLLSVILNLLSLLVLFGLVRALAGERAGLAAAFLGAISPLQIYHAQDLRMYALLALAQMAYWYFFVIFWKQNSKNHDEIQNGPTPGPSPVRGGEIENLRDLHRESGANLSISKFVSPAWLGIIVSGAVAMYSHNLAIFGLVVPDIFLLFRREWRRLGQLLMAQAVIGILALPWLFMIPGQIAKIQRAFWTPQPGIVEIIQSLILFTTNLPLPGIWLGVGLAVSLMVMFLIAMESVRLWKKSELPTLLPALALIPPVFLFAASYLMRPVFVTRGFLAAALAYLGLAGVMIARRWPRIPAGLVLAGFIIGAGIGLPSHYTFNEFPRSPFQPAMQALQAVVQPGDRIIHDDKLSFFPSLFYAPNLPQRFLPDAPGSANDTLALASQQAMSLYPETDIDHAVGDARRVYFVVFDTTLQEYQQAGEAEHPQVAWLKSHFKQNGETRYQDLVIFEFVR
jgi:mannosyltransferase